MKRSIFAVGASLFALIGAMPAAAQSVPEIASESAVEQASDSAIEDIVVTAQRREERLQTTPIAITALTGEALAERGVTNFNDVSRFAPNVDISLGGNGGGSFTSQVHIRGVGQDDFIITSDPGVGTYIDGVYFARAFGGLVDLLDVERVEILRGPQGTLFGKNTIGGALSVTTKKPGSDFEGAIQATTGRFNRVDVSGSLNIPISDTLATRFSLATKNRDGFARRADGSDMGDEHFIGGRALVQWQPSANFDLLISADGTRYRQGASQAAIVELNPAAGPFQLWSLLVRPRIPGQPAASVANPTTPFLSTATGTNISNLDSGGLSAILEWRASENLSVKSITAYRALSTQYGRDADNSPAPYIDDFHDVDQNQLSQEIQILGDAFDERLKFVVGANYFGENATDRSTVRIFSGLYGALESLPAAIIPAVPGVSCSITPQFCFGGRGNPLNIGLDLDIDLLNDVDNTSYAAFGQATYALTDQLSLTAGARFTRDEKRYYLDHRRPVSNVPVIAPTTVSDAWQNTSFRAGLDFKASDDIFLYASFSQGFKSGGFNGRPTNQGAIESYRPETVNSYEVGVKTDFWNGRGRFNLASFYNSYSDIQLTSFITVPGSGLTQVIENAGDAEIYGLEGEFEIRPATGLTITATAAWTENAFTKLGANVVTVNANSRLPKTPRWKSNLAATWTLPISNGVSAYIGGDWTYSSGLFNDVNNTVSLSQGKLHLFNLRAGVRLAEDKLELSIFGRNVTDQRYIVAGVQSLGTTGGAEANFARPREWGASLSYRF